MWLVPRSARLNVIRLEPKGSKGNLKNFECTFEVDQLTLSDQLEFRIRKDSNQINDLRVVSFTAGDPIFVGRPAQRTAQDAHISVHHMPRSCEPKWAYFLHHPLGGPIRAEAGRTWPGQDACAAN